MLRKRYRRAMFFCVLAGIILGGLASGAWQRAAYYEPLASVPLEAAAEAPQDRDAQGADLPGRKGFTLLLTGNPGSGGDGAGIMDSEGLDRMLKEALGKNLTLREQLTVMRIVLTRLSAAERRKLLALAKGDVPLEEALEAVALLRERLTEEEMVLVFGLMRKYRSQLEELIRK